MDGHTAVLGGASTHMFGQEELSAPPPGRGGEETECPLSHRALDTQQIPTGRQAVSETLGGIGVLPHRRGAWGAGF